LRLKSISSFWLIMDANTRHAQGNTQRLLFVILLSGSVASVFSMKNDQFFTAGMVALAALSVALVSVALFVK
jgi:hypothetical protein